MAAIYLSQMGQSRFYEAETSSSSSLPPFSPSQALLELGKSEPILFHAAPMMPLSRLLNEMEEKLAIASLNNIASATASNNPILSNYCRMMIEKNNDGSYELVRCASLLYLHAQNNKLLLLAHFLYNQFGQSLITYYREHYHILKKTHLGMLDIDFDALICKEIEYAQSSPQTGAHATRLMFDSLFFARRSIEFLNFWNGLEAPYEDFRARLAAFPYHGMINYLPAQLELWKEFQNDPRLKDFPIQEIWRFGIDRDAEVLGPCAFEAEPGYMNAFLHGMFFALKSAAGVKNEEWYIRLHEEMSSRSLFPSLDGIYDVSHKDRWNPRRPTFSQFTTALRTCGVTWNYKNLDHDPLGMDELRKRRFIRIDDADKTINCPNISSKSIDLRLTNVMLHYQQLAKNAGDNRVKRLLVYLAHARQLSLDHYFNDANARSSHTAFLSLIKNDRELPFPLFCDQNIFDANSIESVVYRYLEACVNFRKGGQGPFFPKMNQIKRLKKLDLSEYPELKALKKGLKPLVVGKKWDQVIPSYKRKHAKRGEREYDSEVNAAAKRVLSLASSSLKNKS